MTHERKVGIVVAIAALLLLASVFVVGKVRLGVSGYYVKARFKFVNDLKIDAPVKYAGGPVIGRVRDVKVDEDMVLVTLWIDRAVRIREDCEFWIFTSGMLGEVYVEINASLSGVAPFLPDGAIVRGVDPISIDATMIRAGKMMDTLTPIFAKEEVAASVHRMIANLNAVSDRISRVVEKHAAGVDAALSDLETASRSARTLSKELEALSKALAVAEGPESVRGAVARVNAAMASLQAAAVSMDSVARKLDTGSGLLPTLLNDPQLALDVKAVVKNFKDKPITAKVRLF
ncbi:MAG: MlaD family protein [Candidatus Coatesbacteria bacterium]